MSVRGRHLVVREIDRPPLDVVDRLGATGTATIHEAIGRRGFLGPRLRPIQHDVRIAGAAVTAVAGFVCWFVLTPVDGVLREPIALMVPVLGLAAVAGWRTRHSAR